MVYLGNYEVLRNKVSACDHDFLLRAMRERIKADKSLLIYPTVSYTLMLAFLDKKLSSTLAKSDYLVPDSQWVRWSLRFLYRISLKDRVYGPELMLKTCSLSEKEGYKVFLYGTTKETLGKLERRLREKFPKIKIATRAPLKYGDLSKKEKERLITEIKRNKVNVLFIGLGSPRQEIFAHDLVYKGLQVKEPMVIIPVGAAFDFISGVKPQAPPWMQQIGLEWVFRLLREPGRLWRRYLFYGVAFAFLVLAQRLSLLPKSPRPR